LAAPSGEIANYGISGFHKTKNNFERERFIAKVTQKHYQETGSCGSISYITFHYGRHLAEKSLLQFPVANRQPETISWSHFSSCSWLQPERTRPFNHRALFAGIKQQISV